MAYKTIGQVQRSCVVSFLIGLAMFVTGAWMVIYNHIHGNYSIFLPIAGLALFFYGAFHAVVIGISKLVFPRMFLK